MVEWNPALKPCGSSAAVQGRRSGIRPTGGRQLGSRCCRHVAGGQDRGHPDTGRRVQCQLPEVRKGACRPFQRLGCGFLKRRAPHGTCHCGGRRRRVFRRPDEHLTSGFGQAHSTGEAADASAHNDNRTISTNHASSVIPQYRGRQNNFSVPAITAGRHDSRKPAVMAAPLRPCAGWTICAQGVDRDAAQSSSLCTCRAHAPVRNPPSFMDGGPGMKEN